MALAGTLIITARAMRGSEQDRASLPSGGQTDAAAEIWALVGKCFGATAGLAIASLSPSSSSGLHDGPCVPFRLKTKRRPIFPSELPRHARACIARTAHAPQSPSDTTPSSALRKCYAVYHHHASILPISSGAQAVLFQTFPALAIIAAGVATHCARSIGCSFELGSGSAKAVVTADKAARGTGLSGNRCRFFLRCRPGRRGKIGRGKPGRREFRWEQAGGLLRGFPWRCGCSAVARGGSTGWSRERAVLLFWKVVSVALRNQARTRLANGQKAGYQVHSSGDSGKMGKNSRTRTALALSV
jgi:hypothetical protein